MEEMKLPKEVELAISETAAGIRDDIGAETMKKITQQLDKEMLEINKATSVEPRYADFAREYMKYEQQNPVPQDEPSTPTYPYDSEGCYFNEKDNLTIQAATAEHSAVTIFNINNQPIITIKCTGEVVLGDGIAPEYAAHEFWNRLAELGGLFQKRLQLSEDLVEDAKAVLKKVRVALETPEGASLVQHAEEIMEHVRCMEDEVQSLENDLEEEIVAGFDMHGFQESEAPGEEAKSLDKAYKQAMKVVE